MDNRDASLKAIYRDFPDVPQGWAEMVYDFCVKHEGTKEMLNSSRRWNLVNSHLNRVTK